jgi:hypothetical protein
MCHEFEPRCILFDSMLSLAQQRRVMRELCYETIATLVQQCPFGLFKEHLASQLYPLFAETARLTPDLLALGILVKRYVEVRSSTNSCPCPRVPFIDWIASYGLCV